MEIPGQRGPRPVRRPSSTVEDIRPPHAAAAKQRQREDLKCYALRSKESTQHHGGHSGASGEGERRGSPPDRQGRAKGQETSPVLRVFQADRIAEKRHRIALAEMLPGQRLGRLVAPDAGCQRNND